MAAGGSGGNAGDAATPGSSGQGGPPQIYHRVETPTQTAAVARMQERSGQVWGQPARWSSIPSVKAYFGPLPNGRRGIEFTTQVPHDPKYSDPYEARWYHPHTPGVTLNGQGFAVIPATVTNKQVP